MGTHTWSHSGPEGQAAVAALGVHLPAGVMGTPLVVSDGTVLDEGGAMFSLDARGAWRAVGLAGGGDELTCWHRSVEVARLIDLPGAEGPR